MEAASYKPAPDEAYKPVVCRQEPAVEAASYKPAPEEAYKPVVCRQEPVEGVVSCRPAPDEAYKPVVEEVSCRWEGEGNDGGSFSMAEVVEA